ncbi:MAG: ABC transporter permease [Actinobacteria bacterium]|nr:ABC transporter permease [Actinomycetota bacterium]
MTDQSVAAGGGPPGALLRAARPAWTSSTTQALPYILVPVLFVLLVALLPGYLTRNSILSLLILSSLLGLSSLGQTMTIIAGGIDLSIPAVIGLSDIIITQLYNDHMPLLEIFAAIAGLAILIGAINAIASVLLHVHSLITSFGMGLIVGGIALLWSNGALTGKVPGWLTSAVSPIGKAGPIPVPLVIIVWVVAAILAIGFMRLTRIGRETYALGANPLAARLANVRSTWTLVVAFCISALCAALVGVFFAGYSAIPDSTVGQPYFFETITAVIVGGTSLLGGRGGYLRTVLGALIVAELTTLLVGVGFNASFQELGLGILVIVLTSTYGREIKVAAKI